MVRVKRPIVAAAEIFDNKFSFKPSEVLQLISEIDELRGYKISLEKSSNGNMQFVVGDSVYQVVNDVSCAQPNK